MESDDNCGSVSKTVPAKKGNSRRKAAACGQSERGTGSCLSNEPSSTQASKGSTSDRVKTAYFSNRRFKSHHQKENIKTKTSNFNLTSECDKTRLKYKVPPDSERFKHTWPKSVARKVQAHQISRNKADSGEELSSQQSRAETGKESEHEINPKRKRSRHRRTSKNDGNMNNRQPIQAENKQKLTQQTNKDIKKSQGNNHSQKTSLYLVFTEQVSEKNDIKGFINYRMNNPKGIDFEITRVMRHQNWKQDVVVALFPSRGKADYAKRRIQESNAQSSNKILCFFTQREVDNTAINPKDTDRKKEQIIDGLFERAEIEFERHSLKIKETNEQLEIRQRNLKSKRGLSLDLYEKNTKEKQALEDRLQELELQLKEYVNYLQSMKSKLAEIEDDRHFDAGVVKIRKEFGIECQRLSKALPMYAKREEILTTVNSHQVSVLLGETGSGKSTQVVQYLYQAGIASTGLIACTQPRKIAAISLATHVAKEMASSVGQEIGYKVGMQSKKTSLTKVLYMTDHVLLNECLQDPDFSAYSCVIIDEAHERSIHTDLLLGMLKKCLSSRKDLKVIITSATINPDVFVQYFGGQEVCPVLKVSGRTFPVDVFWEPDDPYDAPFPEEYEDKAVKKAVEIHRSNPIKEGDILVFLTSPAETEKCSRRFKQIAASDDYECLLLHGKLDATEQKKVFEKSLEGRRKIVFATNSAETSITIPGIKFVIDTGVVKEMRYDQKKNMNSLDIRPISQSSADQRKGRAGRTASGICYRLYSENNFAAMDKGSTPEILRVHLGQSMLKLLELGVDVMSFDFVESPGRDALSEAFILLNNLGAINGGCITELGKWLAKLPVEPRLGLLIKLGIDADVPIEAAVVAASSNQSSVFYRGGTQEQKNLSDLRKVPFAHTGGDLLTILEVYRSWYNLPEKQKAPWCFKNSINSKAMNGIREIVKETLWTLDKELGLKIKYELQQKDQADGIIQKIIFQSMHSNLSLFLGHEQAGYFIVDRDLHAKVHPSSSLCSLALQPRWVVYSQLVKTSQDFITNVTPVSEEDVKDAKEKGMVILDMDRLNSLPVKQACKKPVGKHVLWKFVGPRHSNRRQVEVEISQICDNTLVVIEADGIRSEISLYCREIYQEIASQIMLVNIAEAAEHLLNETLEDYIGNSGCGVRVLLRSGGMVVDVLMPNEYRVCSIKEKMTYNCQITEDSVQNAIAEFGIIEQLWRPRYVDKRDLVWGKVTFVSYQDAVRAVTEINNDEDACFTLEPVQSPTNVARNQGFKLKLHWCRRKNKGHCFAKLENPEDLAPLLGSSIIIDDLIASVKIPRRAGTSDILIEPIDPEVKEEEVKQALALSLGLNLPANTRRFQIIIPRQNASYLPRDKDMVKQKLALKLAKYCERNSFYLFVRDYKDQTAFCSAEATFSDAKECEKAAKGLILNDDHIYGSLIQVDLEYKSSVFVPKYVYTVSKRDIDDFLLMRKQKRSTTSVYLRTVKSGNSYLDIKACSMERLAKIKLTVDQLIAGKTIDCSVTKHGHGLFTQSARKKLDMIRKRTNTIISADERRMKVTIQGLTENIEEASRQIQSYIESVAEAMEMRLPLKGEGNPPGFMKTLLMKFGISLQKLRDAHQLVDVKLNLKLHELTLVGDEESLKQSSENIEEIRKELIEKSEEIVSRYDLPDCPICLCEVAIGDITRLEQCGHAYCNTCLASLVRNAVTSKEFPILCSSNECKKPLVTRDITFQIKMGSVSRRELVDASLDCFIRTNQDFSCCITPDCPMVYRVTSSGDMFFCGLCMTSICTSCRVRYHDGLSCLTYQLTLKAGDSVGAWLKEEPDNRKLCPKCEVGIEKVNGCNHMTCKCGAHICWKCLKYFDDSLSCCGHLNEEHGSIF